MNKAVVIIALSLAVVDNGISVILKGAFEQKELMFLSGILRTFLYITALIFACVSL